MSYVSVQKEKILSLVDGGRALANTCRKHMRILSTDSEEYEQKKGRIHRRALKKLCVDPGYKTPFKRVVPGLNLNSKVTLLIDNSGSMSGSKFQHAVAAGLLMNRALEPLGVDTRVVLFSEIFMGHQPEVVHVVLKHFGRKSRLEAMVDKAAKAANEYQSQNADGESVLWEYEVLRKNSPTNKRFLFVMSDGSPACDGNCSGQDGLLMDAVKRIESDPLTTIAGLGIFDHNVKRYYSNNVVVKSGQSLEASLITLVEQTITKRI